MTKVAIRLLQLIKGVKYYPCRRCGYKYRHKTVLMADICSELDKKIEAEKQRKQKAETA